MPFIDSKALRIVCFIGIVGALLSAVLYLRSVQNSGTIVATAQTLTSPLNLDNTTIGTMVDRPMADILTRKQTLIFAPITLSPDMGDIRLDIELTQLGIINGEKGTGVTTFFLQHEIDTGRVIRRATIPIGEDETAGELHDRMMVIGARTLVESLDEIASGKVHAIDQQQLISGGDQLMHAPKIFKDDCRIDWQKNTREVHNFIRGLSPYPAAWTVIGDKTLKIFRGTPSQEIVQVPFETDGKSYLRFSTADGSYLLTDVQLEGKKRMGIEEFLRGWRP